MQKTIIKLMALLIFISTYALSAVNLNTATKEELMSLTGIGASKADAIIEYRNAIGFKKIEDIKNIKGIGDKMFEKIKGDISVSGETVIKDKKSVKKDKKADKKKDNNMTKLKDKKDKIVKETKKSIKE